MQYQVISLFSSIIREFINNPLESYIQNISLNITGVAIIIFVLKYWPVIMHWLTFKIVGGIYKKNECPPIGSMLYLFVFLINSKLLKLIVKAFGNTGILLGLALFFMICAIEFVSFCKLRKILKG